MFLYTALTIFVCYWLFWIVVGLLGNAAFFLVGVCEFFSRKAAAPAPPTPQKPVTPPLPGISLDSRYAYIASRKALGLPWSDQRVWSDDDPALAASPPGRP